MNKYKNCVKAQNGDVFCYDSKHKQFVRIVEEPMDIKQVPLEVITSLLALLDNSLFDKLD